MESQAPWDAKLRIGLAAKLALSLVLSTVALFTLFGYLNLRLQRRQSEETVLQSVDRIGDLIQRSTRYQMLRNDRDALYQVIQTIGSEPGIRRIRIFNEEGRISFSTDPSEVSKLVDKRAEACYGCHSQTQPLAKLNRPDRARIFTDAQGHRVLGSIRPIENDATCSNASCHAHPPDRRILGVIDTDLSLDTVDAQVAQHQARLAEFTAVAVMLMSLVSVAFIWVVVHKPINDLTNGIRQVAQGDLDHTIAVHSRDELGVLADSFNKMTGELSEAHRELTDWTKTLEVRVEQKTEELNRAHEHMLHVEKMASIGKLAAVVAHEINNPLAGILTYAKLLKKWVARWDGSRREDALSSLDLIESESRRCGEIVRNMLTFARATPINFEPADLNGVVDRSVRLVQHQLDLGNIDLNLNLAADLPAVRCDPAQIEQVLVALIMNAIEAMPKGGSLAVRSRLLPETAEVQLQIQDDGVGIPPDLLPNLFEPFFTTKERGHGVGLGLAISKNIVERHQGRIEVASDPGRGTTFTITLPVHGVRSATVPASHPDGMGRLAPVREQTAPAKMRGQDARGTTGGTPAVHGGK
ncbi:MAG TPA: ATP-binding protein [Terriglobia bacterium]|nr:ATP-binding protein [Terriglobia bacterium]